MAKAKKSFVEEYEIKEGVAITAVSAAASYVWWQLLSANALDSIPWHQRVAPLLIAAIVLFIVQSGKLNRKQQAYWLRGLTHASAVTIFFMLFWDYWNWLHLNINWYNDRTFFTGQAAISYLLLSLAVTPLITLFGWSSLNAVKKPLGNYGFLFVLVHLILFTIEKSLVGDSLQLGLAIEEAILKRYALVGFLAFVLLVPLALTSNKWSQKKLGKNWKKLHKLAYFISVLGVTHYIWVWWSKRALEKPIAFAIILAFLLFLRVDWIKTKIRDYKRARRAAQRAAA